MAKVDQPQQSPAQKWPARKKYGIQWPAGLSDLQIELHMFRLSLDALWYSSNEEHKRKHPFESYVAGELMKRVRMPEKHFMAAAKVMFPNFIWHPWAIDMLNAVCKHKYVGVAGCSHIGKSEFAAIWGLINYLAMPNETLVLMTSSSLSAARKRCWGSLEKLWTSVPNLPGKMVSSPSPGIRYRTPAGEYIESQGVYLIPAEPRKSAEVTGKMQGMKSLRVILCADELAALSHALIETATSNLNNNSIFRWLGIANPSSYFDPFGIFVKPKNGWSSIHAEMEEWETELGGICLHFDAYKSPNYLLGKDKWPILSITKIKEAEEKLGPNTPRFWQMMRGFWCPSGMSNKIYPEVDLEAFGAFLKATWKSDKIKVAALDPSFTSGGDRTMSVFGELGETIEGKMTLMVTELVELREDVLDKANSRDFQIAKQFKLACESRGVLPEHAAVDATGAGMAFASIIEQTWSNKIFRVQFGGAASDLPTPQSDGKPANTLFSNRVSELWMVGLEYLRGGQIRGITSELAKEMGQREYELTAGKFRVEPKAQMKAKGYASPDCFVAGTLVTTPKGLRAIETLTVGEFVDTPFGPRRIEYVHEIEVNELWDIYFSDGRTLRGTGNHRIWTWNFGWVSLARGKLDMRVETHYSLWKWKILSLLFIRGKSIFLAGREDTITIGNVSAMQPEKSLSRKRCFTGAYGLTIMAVYLPECLCIIATLIVQTMIFLIYSLCLNVSTRPYMQDLILKIQSTEKRIKNTWRKYVMRRTPGDAVSVVRGILKVFLCWGIRGKLRKGESASCVGHASGQQMSVLSLVRKSVEEYGIPLANGNVGSVPFAERFLFRLGKSPRSTAVQRVTISPGVKTFNLTLESENIYYANGVLVANCADAFHVMLALCREKLGMGFAGIQGSRKVNRENWKAMKKRYNSVFKSEGSYGTRN